MSKHAAKFEPIERVMVSSKVGGDTELEQINSLAVWKLHQQFKEILNSNGDTTFGLTDLEEKIVKAADAFVFLPIPKAIKQLKALDARELFREMFKAASLFVGAQTKDPHLRLNPEDGESPLKPIVLVNHEGCWDPFLELVNHMHALGTITQKPEAIIQMVSNIEGAIKILEHAHTKKVTRPQQRHAEHSLTKHQIEREQKDPGEQRKPEFNVCVFCSASTKNPELLSIARQLGGNIAARDWGLVTGLGRTGMMGTVVSGAAEVVQHQHKGWVAGSNLPRIINMEGLPEYYDRFWCNDDIYNRMDAMIKNSQAFVIMPGGMGTVQELMALLLLKYHKTREGESYLMRDDTFANKPIIIVNHETMLADGKKVKF